MTEKDHFETGSGNEEMGQKPMFESARKVLLAGIGVIALAQEEIEDFVTRLVERGEIAEKDGRKLVLEIKEERMKEAGKVEDEVRKRVEVVLERMRIPTKTEIDEINKELYSLKKRVKELSSEIKELKEKK